MNLKENDVLTDIVDSCDEIRPTTTKNWLNSATSSLAKLDNVKPNVYNVGLIDHKDLKATNLALKTLRNTGSLSELTALAPLGTQKLAWGSNPSIPDLLKQQNGKVPSRPVSAKVTRKPRPPSAGKLRPQSAKNPCLPPPHPTDTFSIHGSKFDRSERPPSGAFHQNPAAGWTGAPPVFKYTHSTENITDLNGDVLLNTARSPPPPPTGTPDFTANNLQNDNCDADIIGNLEEDQLPDYAEPVPAAPVVLKPIHLSLPTEDIDNDNDDDDPDTARLIEEVEKHTLKKQEVGKSGDKQQSNLNISHSNAHMTNGYEPEIEHLREHEQEKSSKAHLIDLDKDTVQINEKNNVQIDITPRNRRRKASGGDSRRPSSGKINLRHVQSRVNSGLRRPLSNTKKPPNSVEDESKNTSFNVSLSPETNKKRLSMNSVQDSNRRQISKVTVAYEEEENNNEESMKARKQMKNSKAKPQQVQSLFSQLTLSDSDLDFVSDDGSDNEFDRFDTSSKEFRPVSSTKMISEPGKNYYEVSRHSIKQSSPTIKDDCDEFLVKAVKTIEFDRDELKETVEYSKIDVAQKVRSVSPVERPKSKLYTRPPSAKKQVKKLHFTTYEPESDEERPGSRIGFVAMAPEKQTQKKSPRTPLKGADENGYESVHRATKPRKCRTRKNDDVATLINQGNHVSSSSEFKKSVEDESVCDRYMEETKFHERRHDDVETLMNRGETTLSEHVVSSLHKSRPQSAKPVLSKCHCSVNRPSSGKRPVSASEAKRSNIAIQIMRGEKLSEKAIANELKKRVLETRKHYANHARRASPEKVEKEKVYDMSNAFIINTKKPRPYIETEEVLQCRETQQILDDNGIDVDIEILERALFPPKGDSTYYEVTANLPSSTTSGLLSHPKHWIPEEYKKFKLAEKKLAKAEEIMWMQKKAEERRARLAEGRTGSVKKAKGKKKLISKLRKSHSLG